jgi:putative transposase
MFSTKNRENVLEEKYNVELHKYISSVVKDRKCRLYTINNISDHMHILASIHPTLSISKFMRDIKSFSSKFINEKGWYKEKFQWQEGYGAFSCSQSQLNSLIKYIQNQKEHHENKTFREEYIEFLKKYKIGYDEKYL